MATSATPPRIKFARRLLACETGPGESLSTGAGVYRVCEKLRGSLGKLMGVDGFRALLCRALALAGKESSSLLTVRIRPDGSIERVEQETAESPHRDADADDVLLVAHLLGLLVTFIGPALTLRLVHEIWPDADARDFELL